MLSGPGLGLPAPQNLYPSDLFNAPYDFSNAYQGLAPGDALVIPAGNWIVGIGPYSFLQWFDVVSQTWRGFNSGRMQPVRVKGDGFNIRVANLTSCPVAGVVTAAGAGYLQGNTTINPSVGNSTWQAIVGGLLTAPSVTAKGAGFSVQPIVFIPGPPSPGVQATAYASIAAGTVSGVTLVNGGAGYTGGSVTGLLLANPTDPNQGSVTAGTVVFTVGGAGSLTAALCTNPGAALATIGNLSLSVAGSGASATVSPVVPQSLQSISISGGGTGFGNAMNAMVTTAGGGTAPTDAIGNPEINLKNFIPRPALGTATSNAGGTLVSDVVYDGGLFTSAPAPILIAATGLAPTAAATLVFTMGGVNDTVLIQPAP